jgi:GMP synthase (glutamine-hydrolysing)
MLKSRSNLKILLLQIREDALTQQEELNEFVRFSLLRADQIDALNVFETPVFDPACSHGYDALFVGGSSDASVTQPEKYPFVEASKQLMRYCWQTSQPVFASCFGFQLAVEALGGKVIVDRPNKEIGTYPIQLTEAATRDRLFHDVPNGFWAIAGHQERAISLPSEAISLAFTEKCPYQAFRMAGKPFYAFQFHPEVDRADLTLRLTRYCDRYLDDSAALKGILTNLQDTAIANQLIERFVDRILLQQFYSNS